MLVSASIPALACCNSVPSAFPFHLHGLIGVKTKGRSRREVSRGRRSHFAIVRRGMVGGRVAPLAHVQARLLLYPPLLPVGRRRLVQGWRKVGRRWLGLSPLTAVVTRIVLLLLLLAGGDEVLSIVVILQVSTSLYVLCSLYITSVRYLNILCSCPISTETTIKDT